ncbi:MAG: murein L,D-transpeptidase catalytic domain-containing protein [Gemmatimonadales bacterium]
MEQRTYLIKGLLGAMALTLVGARLVPGSDRNGPVLHAAVTFVAARSAKSPADGTASGLASRITDALHTFEKVVRPLSHPKALETAFRSYFTYKAAHPDEVRKPLLYFVDYGLPSTEPRGYVFDMNTLQIVEGPFTVAHGRGSSTSQYGVPTRFSNGFGSAATSLGLYLAEATYAFHGHTGGRSYRSIGLRLKGVSDGFNDNALSRGVVAHGAPYVTSSKAGRSEGCPAMEQQRAQEILPKIAQGGMVFLFAPDQQWMAHDPWVAATTAN